MFFFLPWNIYRNSAYSFFYPGIFLQTVHVHLYPGTLLQTVQVLFLNFLPWNISTNSACSFSFFFSFFFSIFFTLEHFYKQCMFFIFFLLWNISTNCMFFFPLGHFYKQPLFYYIIWIFYSIISVSNFVLCLLFLFTANSWCPGRSMLIYSPTSNQILTAPFLWGLMDL